MVGGGTLTWSASCRSWERRDTAALSRSRPWISRSSLCSEQVRVGGQVAPRTGLPSSQHLQASGRAGGVCGKLPFPPRTHRGRGSDISPLLACSSGSRPLALTHSVPPRAPRALAPPSAHSTMACDTRSRPPELPRAGLSPSPGLMASAWEGQPGGGGCSRSCDARSIEPTAHYPPRARQPGTGCSWGKAEHFGGVGWCWPKAFVGASGHQPPRRLSQWERLPGRRMRLRPQLWAGVCPASGPPHLLRLQLVGDLAGPVARPHLTGGQVLQPGAQVVPEVLKLLVGEARILHRLLPAEDEAGAGESCPLGTGRGARGDHHAGPLTPALCWSWACTDGPHSLPGTTCGAWGAGAAITPFSRGGP